MFDAELQIVSSQVVDVSENAEQLSTSVTADKLLVGKRGFPENSRFVVHIEATDIVTADDAVEPVKFVLQGTLDQGSNWFDMVTITLVDHASLTKKGVYSAPLGFQDFRMEMRVEAAADDDELELRVAVQYSDTTETHNFTYSAYIGTGNQFRSNDQ
jgi:hypothetical protein